MTTIEIELPDDTVKAAREAGLLTPQALEELLQEAIKRQQAKAPAQPIDEEQGHPKYGLLFGMWRDREDMRDVAGYVRSIRADRFSNIDTPPKK